VRSTLQYYLPVPCISLGAKLLLLVGFAPALSALQMSEAFVEDLSLHAVILAGITLALSLTRAPVTRGIVQIAAGGLCLSIVAFELAAIAMLMETGVAVDRHLLYYTAENVWMVAPILWAEVDPFVFTALITLLAVGSALRMYKVRKTPPQRIRKLPPLVLACIGLAGIALPPLAVPSGFGRATLVDVLAGGWLYPIERLPADAPPDSRQPQPFRRDGRLTELPKRDYDHLVIVALESTGLFATSLLSDGSQSDGSQSDGLQSDGLQSDGPQTTPYLAELRDRGVWFPHAYSAVPHSSKAITAILCGISPYPLMHEREAEVAGIPASCLPELLSREGFATAYFGAHSGRFEHREQQTVNLGFRETITREDVDPSGFQEANYLALEDDVLLEPTREWLRNTTGRRRFAFYLTTTAHHAYDTPDRYAFQEFSADEEQNRYLNSVYYQDRFLEQLIQLYTDAGLASRTLFVVVGDHGEAFGEHGRSKHNSVIYDEGLRIPLVLYATGLEPEIRDAIVGQVDIPVTAARRLGFELSGTDYEGVDLFGRDASSVVYATCWYNDRCLARISDARKIISHFGYGAPEAFALRLDPRETRNAFGELETDSQQLAELHAWKRRLLARYERSPRVPALPADRGRGRRSPPSGAGLPEAGPSFDNSLRSTRSLPWTSATEQRTKSIEPSYGVFSRPTGPRRDPRGDPPAARR